MKKILSLLLFVSAMSAISIACAQVKTITRTVSNYAAIKNSGVIDVTVKSGQPGKITVRADAKMQPDVLISVENGLLTIKPKRKLDIDFRHKILVTVPAKKLDYLYQSGIGDVIIQGPLQIKKLYSLGIGSLNATQLKSDGLKIYKRGIGNINVSGRFNLKSMEIYGTGGVDIKGIDSKNLTVKKYGTGRVRLFGRAADLDLLIRGVGNVDARKLYVENAKIELYGAGKTNVSVSNTLQAKLVGFGGIYYCGKPKNINREVIGFGHIGPC